LEDRTRVLGDLKADSLRNQSAVFKNPINSEFVPIGGSNQENEYLFTLTNFKLSNKFKLLLVYSLLEFSLQVSPDARFHIKILDHLLFNYYLFITLNIPSISELINEFVDGLLVKMDPTEMAETIIQFISDLHIADCRVIHGNKIVQGRHTGHQLDTFEEEADQKEIS
jgi:hypothetical protein